MVLNLFTGKQWRNRHIELTYGHGERGGEGELYRKSIMETFITICKIDSQWNSLYGSGDSYENLPQQMSFLVALSPS